MNSIWKYPLKTMDEQAIEVPKDGIILSAQFQGDYVCLWIIVDTDPTRKKDKRWIRMVGSGGPPRDMKKFNFISTCQTEDKLKVWHVFEDLSYHPKEQIG